MSSTLGFKNEIKKKEMVTYLDCREVVSKMEAKKQKTQKHSAIE